MIVWLVASVLALAIGGVLAALVLRDPGYVLISYADATLETSLWFAAGTLLVFWLGLSGSVHLVRRLLRSGPRVAAWMASRRQRTARRHSQRGAMLLAEERWREAGEALLAPPANETPLLDYFGAAKAANELDDYPLRDQTLDRAKEAIPEADFVVELRRAELQQAAAQWQQSQATLSTLRERAPRHPLVLERLFAAYAALDDWDAVAELAPLLPEATTTDVQVAIWRARLRRSEGGSEEGGTEQAHAVWRSIPKRLRDEESLLMAYVDVLASRNASAAETALREGLKRRWTSAWVRRYGEIRSDPLNQLKRAAKWLERHPDDPALLCTLGRLAAAAGELKQAKAYFEASQRAEPSAATLAELGTLCVANGEPALANDYFQRSLAAKA